MQQRSRERRVESIRLHLMQPPEQLVDELNLSPNIRTTHRLHLSLPDHVAESPRGISSGGRWATDIPTAVAAEDLSKAW